jgi:hypothetical protein
MILTDELLPRIQNVSFKDISHTAYDEFNEKWVSVRRILFSLIGEESVKYSILAFKDYQTKKWVPSNISHASVFPACEFCHFNDLLDPCSYLSNFKGKLLGYLITHPDIRLKWLLS